MSTDRLKKAQRMADFTFELVDHCQLKQKRISESLGLTVAEFRLLRCFRGDYTLSVGELARRMGLSNSRLTRILDGLVEKGIVRRDIAPQDRRMMEVMLTTEGKKIEKNLEKTYIQTHEEILQLIPAGAVDSVLLAMEKLRDAMNNWVKE